ncbi:MAG TPA: hypothetical protein VGE97_00835, partial [Nitrososphaera sp.]
LDNNGSEVYNQTGLVAKGGTSSQTINFPRNDNFSIAVQVTGIAKDGQPVDQTRNGIARGTVVVPEFNAGGLAVAAITGIAVASVIILQRWFARIRLGSGFQ